LTAHTCHFVVFILSFFNMIVKCRYLINIRYGSVKFKDLFNCELLGIKKYLVLIHFLVFLIFEGLRQ
jgi:hypothetical protein